MSFYFHAVQFYYTGLHAVQFYHVYRCTGTGGGTGTTGTGRGFLHISWLKKAMMPMAPARAMATQILATASLRLVLLDCSSRIRT